MNLDNLSGMINAVPLIMAYIVPGYIFLKISHFQLSGRADRDQYILAKSLIISFFFISAGEFLWNCLFPGVQALSNVVFRNIMIASSAVAGLLWSRFLTGAVFGRALHSLGIHKTLQEGIWSDIADFEYGLWLMIYIPADKVVYAGKLRRYKETEAHNSYMLFLSNYTLYDYNATVLKDYVSDNDKWVALHSKDIGRTELFYHQKSSKISH